MPSNLATGIGNPVLELNGIVKRFLGVTVLDHVDFSLLAGEVHALMGENGAGKSTLIKVMTGVHPPDAGSIELTGNKILPKSTDEAIRLGISTVYQEVNLAPNLTVGENVCLGREPMGLFGIKWNDLWARAEKAMTRLGVSIDVRRPLSSYSIAIQQMVAIARALDVSASVLILDEPTSSLDADEVNQLFQAIRRLRNEGLGIVFITHFLDQVYEITDRVTILRNGKKLGTWKTSALSKLELVSEMIGRDAGTLNRDASLAESTQDLPKPFLVGRKLGRTDSVSGLDFSLGPGEVLGLGGLLGSGRTEVVRLLFGLDRADLGSLEIDGKAIARFTPSQAIRQGIGLCAEDRKAEGIFPDLSVRENILLVMQSRRGWTRRISTASQKEIATKLATQLQIAPPNLEIAVRYLSGGNQQKALLARWIAVEPRLLLLDEPTRGIDVGAKFEIMSLVERMRQDGKSFVFVSSELAELVKTSTKLIVMRDRKPTQLLNSGQISESAIISAIAGSDL